MTKKHQDLTGLTPEQKKARQRAQAKAWRAANKDKIRAWYVRNGGWQGEKARTDPVKVAARRALHEAVRYGRLERGTCEACGAPEGEGHHEDYAKPLDVKWLCRSCHMEEHVRRGDMRGQAAGGVKPPTAKQIEEQARKAARKVIRDASHRKWCWWMYPPDDLFG